MRRIRDELHTPLSRARRPNGFFWSDVDVGGEKFADALGRYVAASGKTFAEACRKKLRDWCFRALKRLRAGLGKTGRMVAWPELGAKGSAKNNWKLVRWLATRQIEYGMDAAESGGHFTTIREYDKRLTTRATKRNARHAVKPGVLFYNRRRLWVRDSETKKIRRQSIYAGHDIDLAKVSQREKAARNKSKGFLMALVINAKNAIDNGGASGSGGIGAKMKVRSDDFSAEVAVQSVARFAGELTRAMQPRDGSTRSAIARVNEAFADAEMEVVADMEKYIADKLEKEARKALA